MKKSPRWWGKKPKAFWWLWLWLWRQLRCVTLSQKEIGSKTKPPSIQPERCHGSEVEELYFGGIFCFKINSSMARFEKKNKHGKHPRCVIVHILGFFHVLRVYCLNICWFWGKACIKACHDLNDDWTVVWKSLIGRCKNPTTEAWTDKALKTCLLWKFGETVKYVNW